MGQPFAGFFLARDFLIASCHLPLILSMSGFRPLPTGFFLTGLDMIGRGFVRWYILSHCKPDTAYKK